MKGFILAIALVLALPLAAFAHSTCLGCQANGNNGGTLIGTIGLSPAVVCCSSSYCPRCLPYGNGGGTLTGTDAGLTLTGSILNNRNGFLGDQGTVTIQTGALLSGSLQSGGTFSDVGSSFIITLNPHILPILWNGGVLFSGTFISTITWSPVAGQPGYYELEGALYGTWPPGSYFAGWGYVTETYYGSFNSNGVFTSTSGGGLAMISPEPGTVGLFATGLIGIGGAIRRKMRL
jgi:adhesin HecA-like repeat protein